MIPIKNRFLICQYAVGQKFQSEWNLTSNILLCAAMKHTPVSNNAAFIRMFPFSVAKSQILTSLTVPVSIHFSAIYTSATHKGCPQFSRRQKVSCGRISQSQGLYIVSHL